VLIDAGFPRPRTQIRVSDGDEVAFIDMGWDEPKIGVDYDGDQHRTDRKRYVHDIGRNEMVRREGWLDLHVVAEHSPKFIEYRVRDACARRGWTPPPSSTRRL
jgi:very-short-patch-repair endonuclease